MKPVYIVAPMRSAVGKSGRGTLRTKRPDDLAADVLKAVVARGQIDPKLIDDVILGCAMPEAEQGMNVARFALLLAGLPESVPGVTVSRACSSGLQSIGQAAFQIAAGGAECILAGGIESMSSVPMMGNKFNGSRTVMDAHPEYYMGMGLTAENVAADWSISRTEQDEFALASHQKAVQAIEKGLFRDEICPVGYTYRVSGAEGAAKIDTGTFSVDEGPRADSTLEALTRLKPAFCLGGSITAGNSSQTSDGAAACLVCSEDFVKAHNLQPMARFAGFAVAGVAPRVMGIGPIEAIPKVLKQAGLKLEQIDRFELNEAFAAQALAVMKTLKLDPSKVNPTGGAIALGHPLGATGAKLTATLLHGMRRDQQKYGIVSMCIGSGMGAAGIFERV